MMHATNNMTTNRYTIPLVYRSHKDMTSDRDEDSCLLDAGRAGGNMNWDTGGQDRQQQQSYEAAFEKARVLLTM